MFRHFVMAWHFLTVIPLASAHHDPTPSDLARSMGWFPLVGLILGTLLAVSDLLLATIFSPSIVNVLMIVILVLLTGGLHLDGLADSVDGLAGGRTSADRLKIMRDAHIGALGATGLMLALALRYAALIALPQSSRFAVLLCMPAVGRWAMVVGGIGSHYARREGGLAQPFLQQLSGRDVIGATVVLVIAFALSVGLIGALVGCIVIVVVTRGLTILAHKLLGGITGDTLGATNEAAEIVFLLMAPAIAGLGPHVFNLR
ncbi:MAG TPA: adenosylcobinamide-GDP ribazoletransferase [Nitrospiraceae bacterium]|nr:adenosylcobinamide-GDP ribazoletransferase [Nitrospiraceae bacterium]